MTRFKFAYSGKLRLFLFSVMVVIFGLMVWIYISAKKVTPGNGNIPISSLPLPTLSIGKVEHTATRDGKTEWTLEAAAGKYLDEDQKVIIEELKIVFFLDDQTTARLEGDEGVLFAETQNIEINGNVVLENRGYRLKTKTIIYDHEKRHLHSDTPIIIENEFLHLTADKMKVDLTNNQTTLTGHVKGFLRDRIHETN